MAPGIGISIAANKISGIRAALCTSVEHALMSRKHNDSNVLALGARMTDFSLTKEIIDAWLLGEFEGGRHLKRINKIEELWSSQLRFYDKEIYDTIKSEFRRQSETLELIASENFTSKVVIEAVGSILTNKYAEGYPGNRYYGGAKRLIKLKT